MESPVARPSRHSADGGGARIDPRVTQTSQRGRSIETGDVMWSSPRSRTAP
jgi:hypothetical protein